MSLIVYEKREANPPAKAHEELNSGVARLFKKEYLPRQFQAAGYQRPVQDNYMQFPKKPKRSPNARVSPQYRDSLLMLTIPPLSLTI
jgi:hypothetical protein